MNWPTLKAGRETHAVLEVRLPRIALFPVPQGPEFFARSCSRTWKNKKDRAVPDPLAMDECASIVAARLCYVRSRERTATRASAQEMRHRWGGERHSKLSQSATPQVECGVYPVSVRGPARFISGFPLLSEQADSVGHPTMDFVETLGNVNSSRLARSDSRNTSQSRCGDGRLPLSYWSGRLSGPGRMRWQSLAEVVRRFHPRTSTNVNTPHPTSVPPVRSGGMKKSCSCVSSPWVSSLSSLAQFTQAILQLRHRCCRPSRLNRPVAATRLAS